MPSRRQRHVQEVPNPTPLISVVVPTRNRRQLVRAVLESLADQEGVAGSDVEVFVIVDGSLDDTVADLRSWRPPYPMDVIAQRRAGASAARNRGWALARADVVLFLDDDVVPCRQLLAEHIKSHQAEEDAVVLGLVEQGPVDAEPWTWYDGWTMRRKYAALAANELPSGIHFGGNFSIARRRLDEVGGFDSRLPRGEHVDLGYRLAERGVKFLYVPAARAEHRGHRDLESWQTDYRLDGRMDVALYRERGYAGGLATIVASYHDRHWLNRALLRVALNSRRLERTLIGATVGVGIAAHRARLRPVARIAMSATANLLYWGGVRDGLRGRRAFWQAIGRTKSHAARAYQLRGHQT